MIHPLPTLELFENLGLFVESIGGYKHRDRPADGFFGCVAEQPFGALIPTVDDASEVFANDGIVEESTIAFSNPDACSACLRSSRSNSFSRSLRMRNSWA